MAFRFNIHLYGRHVILSIWDLVNICYSGSIMLCLSRVTQLNVGSGIFFHEVVLIDGPLAFHWGSNTLQYPQGMSTS